MVFDARHLLEWTEELLTTWGYAPEDAAYVAETLVDANLRGVDSHGVIRLPVYRARIDAGLVDPRAVPLTTTSGATIRIAAQGAPGQLAARAALEQVDTLSSALGTASATVRGSAHFGTAGFYARELARRGKIALVVSNSEPIVVPFGGRSPLLGTNPFAFAAPTDGEPISLDMATSTSAMGRVLIAQSRGASIPADWGVDADGHPTTDPAAVKALLPAGGAKGYGLGILVEILSGVLSESAIAGGIGNMYADFDRPQDVGHFMMALDVQRFLPLEEFRERMQGLIDAAHAVDPAPGSAGVLLPGEPEASLRRERLSSGIDLPGPVCTELSRLGAEAGVAFPSP